MKKKLLLGAAALAVLALFLADHSILVITLPFQWAGRLLRQLSLSGSGGNILAFILYLVIGLLPMLLALGRRWCRENWLLPVSCAALLYALYYMINPGLRPLVLQSDVGSLILCSCFYSLFLCWGVIRLLKSSDAMGTSGICRTLRIFLWLCAAGCIRNGIFGGISHLTETLAAISAGNTAPGQNLFPTRLLTVLTFCVTASEYLLDAWAMYLAVRLLRRIESEPYSEACCAAADRAVSFCKRALIAIILSHTVLNLSKMFLSPLLVHLDASFPLPVVSLAIVFAILAVARLLNQGRQLKEDNELFI